MDKANCSEGAGATMSPLCKMAAPPPRNLWKLFQCSSLGVLWKIHYRGMIHDIICQLSSPLPALQFGQWICKSPSSILALIFLVISSAPLSGSSLGWPGIGNSLACKKMFITLKIPKILKVKIKKQEQGSTGKKSIYLSISNATYLDLPLLMSVVLHVLHKWHNPSTALCAERKN